MSLDAFSLPQLLLVLPIFIAAFILLLTLIVFFHEYGHFSVARLLGVRVDTFSIGFGKPIATWTDKKGTEWRIAWLPLGGYVKFFGDAGPASNASGDVQEEKDAGMATTQFPRPGEEEKVGRGMTPEEKAVCFHFKPLWRRAAIVAAGPIANFILAAVFFWGLLVTFGEPVTEPRVGQVVEGSAAQEAGLLPGDLITAINGKSVASFNDMSRIISLSSGETLTLTVEREGAVLEIPATPRRQERKDGFGNTIRIGTLGVSSDPNATVFVDYGPVSAAPKAVARVWGVLETTVTFIGRLVLGKEDPSQLGGPLKMAQFAGQSALSGFDDTLYVTELGVLEKLRISLANFIQLAAVVSVSIGFLNLLPVPVLDGGHLMYYAYEGVAGRPLGVKAQEIGFRVGLAMLASLMLFVTWNDINSFFSS